LVSVGWTRAWTLHRRSVLTANCSCHRSDWS